MSRHIYFNNRDEFFRISLDQIMFFEADRNYTLLHLANGQRLAFAMSLQRMHDYLVGSLGDDSRMFVRVGKSNIINLTYVFNIDLARRVLRLSAPASPKIHSLKVSHDALRKLRVMFVSDK
ncbi:MAG: LytTR family transcriptional regulator [Barnesiella sp.]|nr:LytTR family transcriptional regulator [Barnesiella sp.]